MAMSEREQAHRHAMEARALDVERDALKSAQKIDAGSRAGGLLALLACIGGAIYLAEQGKEWVAVALVGVPVMAAIGWLLRTRHWRRKKPSVD